MSDPALPANANCGVLETKALGYLVFDYLYRDASNYKAFGSIWLAGTLPDEGQAELVSCLDSQGFFVAEQINIGPLYPSLFELGGGPTEDDHAWHTFEGLRVETALVDGVTVWGEASAFLAGLRSAKGNWQPKLSLNFYR